MSASPPNSSPPNSVRDASTPYTALQPNSSAFNTPHSIFAGKSPVAQAPLDFEAKHLFRPAHSAVPTPVAAAASGGALKHRSNSDLLRRDMNDRVSPATPSEGVVVPTSTQRRETEAVLKPVPTREAPIPYSGHAPALQLPQPSKAALVARAVSPLKPRTQKLPNAESLAEFCLPTMLDLQVSLESMSVGALEGRQFILDQELRRVSAELGRRRAIEARTAAVWEAEGAVRHTASTALIATADSPSPPRYEPPPTTPLAVTPSGLQTPRQTSAATGDAPRSSGGGSLANELRSIAMRAVTPNRTQRQSAPQNVQHGSNFNTQLVPRHHPASGPPSPLRNSVDFSAMLGGGMATPGSGAANHYDYSRAGPSFPQGHSSTPVHPRQFQAGSSAVSQMQMGLSADFGHSTNGALSMPLHRSNPSAASLMGPATLENDFMYPAHHNMLLDELMAMRMKRLGHV